MSNYRNYREEWLEVSDDRMEERIQRRLKQRQIRKKKALIEYFVFCSSIVIIIVVALAIGLDVFSNNEANANATMTEDGAGKESYVYLEKPNWEEDFLTPNEYSRPQTLIEEVNGVVVHYTGNPNTTAKQNRDYFEDLATTHETSASSHFVVGLEGEILQCMPLNEVAYASKHRNADTISIEVCHPTEDGKFTKETYKAVVALVAWLVVEYDLAEDEVIRHYDVTGKECPKYYVQYDSAWEDFKLDVWAYIDKNSEIITK